MKKVFFICIVLVLAMVTAAQAVILPEGSVTLARLIGGGGSIIANDKIFDRFTFFDGFNYGDFSNVWVIPLTDDPSNPGLSYMSFGEWSVTDSNSMELEFGFRVRTINEQFLIKDNSLEIVQYSIEGDEQGGFLRIDETVFKQSNDTPPVLTQIGDKSVIADRLFDEFSLFDHAEFLPQNLIWVLTSIEMIADFDTDVVSLDVFDQRFSQVPEPATMLLLGTGLAGLAGAARRKKKK